MTKKRIHISKKTVLLTVGVVLLLGGALLAGILAQRFFEGQKDPAPALPESQLPRIVDEVQNLRLQGKTDEANKKAQEALEQGNLPTEEKYMLYIQQGNAAHDKQDYPTAIAAYERAYAVQPDYQITRLLGLTWRDAGNNEKAVEYLKKALPLVPKTPMQAEDRSGLETLIKNLGGQL